MAKEVFEQKTPRPAPIAPHANGTALAPRVPVGMPVKRRSGVGSWIVLVIVLLAAIAAGVYFFLPKYLPSFLHKSQSTTTPATAGTGRHGGAGASDNIRVVTATATKGDIGVYLKGLGAVTPLNTDTIQSRVNGQLQDLQQK